MGALRLAARGLAGRLRACQAGQTTVEYFLLLAVLAIGLALASYVLVPNLKHGLYYLIERIIGMNP